MRPRPRLEWEPIRAGGSLRVAEALALLGLVLVVRLVAARVLHIYDDAFITFRYATNLAAGHGLVYNPGAPWEPVLGTTAPGFAVLLAGLARLGASLPEAARTLALLAQLGLAGGILWCLRRNRLHAVLAVGALAALPHLVRIDVGGMEAPLFAFAVLGVALLVHGGRPLLAGALTAAACTLRPEGVLLVPVVAVELWRDRAALARYVGSAAALGLAYAGVLLATYGSFVPHTVRSKAERHSGSLLETWTEILGQAFLPALALAPLLPLVLWGIVSNLRTRGAIRTFTLFALALVGAYLVARPHTWGWYFHVPLVVWCLGLGRGVADAVHRFLPGVSRWAAPAAVRAAVAAAAVLLVVLLSVPLVARDDVTTGVYRPMEAWARETPVRPGERLLASDIGAAGFFLGREVLDTEGLVWPEAVPHRGYQLDLIEAHAPEYVLLTAVKAKVEPFREHPVAALYEPVRRFSALGRTDLAPPTDALPDRWAQDYILFRRRDAPAPGS